MRTFLERATVSRDRTHHRLLFSKGKRVVKTVVSGDLNPPPALFYRAGDNGWCRGEQTPIAASIEREANAGPLDGR